MFRRASTLIGCTVALGLAAPLSGQAHAHHEEHGKNAHTPQHATVPLYDNLGELHRETATASPRAQQYFDQGLRLTYAFNHPEAVDAYRQAAALDPDCAMCYWGIAWALGPNINAGMDSAAGAAAYGAARHALRLIDRAAPSNRALIRAMARRYGVDPLADRQRLDSVYARAMGDVAARSPDDSDAQVLHAEALMLLSPWNYWTADKEPRPGTETLLRRLTRTIELHPDHPGGCHFYIHAVEAAYPERAVDCAERLAALMPGAGHLVHMPGHIYIRVGRYMDAIRANEHAVHADETYIQDRRPGATFYTAGYYPHNYDFMAFAASMAGRSQQAIDAAERVASLVPAEMLRAPGMTFLQQFITRPLQIRVRFGQWDDILRTPAPADDLAYARALWHYAHGRALAARGNAPGAEADLARVRGAAVDPALAEASLEFNAATAIIEIAAEVLAGNIATARGDHARAITHLTRAAELEDGLVYGEPPEWSVPVRHELGAVLVAAGRAAEAERVYRKDLDRFPRNGWALFGLTQALRAQGKSHEAAQIQAQVDEAWESADVTLTASRF